MQHYEFFITIVVYLYFSFQAIENEELRKLEKHSPVMGLSVGIKRTGFIYVGDTVYVGK